MISLLTRRTSSHFLCLFSPFHHHQQFMLLGPLLQQHLPTKPSPLPEKEMPFIAQYLVSNFGFSPERARKSSMSPHLRGTKSPDRPEAVMKFLSDTGLSETQIMAAVSIAPHLLGCNVDKILRPRVREWIEHGFSEELVVQLIRYCPTALIRKSTLTNLLFWRGFISNDVDLLKIIPRMSFLILFDIDKYIAPRISIFKEFGLSNRDIVGLLVGGSRCMSLDVDSLRQTIELIEELGLARGSGMFLCGIKAVGSFSKDQILRKAELYKTTFGWSQEDVTSAFRKFPFILRSSEEKIKSNMDFLIRKAHIEPKSIISCPHLLGYSVEKRLVPRHHVLSILAAKELNKNCSIISVYLYTEKKFLEKYVEPYKKDVPELARAYFAASGKHVSV